MVPPADSAWFRPSPGSVFPGRTLFYTAVLCVGQILHSVTDSRKAAIEDLCGESLLGAGKLLYAKNVSCI